MRCGVRVFANSNEKEDRQRIFADPLRLSKKSGKVWAFSSFCDIMFLGDENVGKEQTAKDTNRNAVHRRLCAARTFVKKNRCGDRF